MNNERRKRISIVHATLAKCAEELESLYDEEQEAMDAMPENMQYNSERWDDMEEGLNQLDYAKTEAESAAENLEHFDLRDVNTRDLEAFVRGY